MVVGIKSDSPLSIWTFCVNRGIGPWWCWCTWRRTSRIGQVIVDPICYVNTVVWINSNGLFRYESGRAKGIELNCRPRWWRCASRRAGRIVEVLWVALCVKDVYTVVGIGCHWNPIKGGHRSNRGCGPRRCCWTRRRTGRMLERGTCPVRNVQCTVGIDRNIVVIPTSNDLSTTPWWCRWTRWRASPVIEIIRHTELASPVWITDVDGIVSVNDNWGSAGHSLLILEHNRNPGTIGIGCII